MDNMDPYLQILTALSLFCFSCSGAVDERLTSGSIEDVTPDAGHEEPQPGVLIVDDLADAATSDDLTPADPATVEAHVDTVENVAPVPTEASVNEPATPDPGATYCERQRAEKQAVPTHSSPPIPCDKVNRLVYYTRGSEAPCGPVRRFSIEREGSSELERTTPDFRGNKLKCAAPSISRIKMKANESAKIIDAVCADFNENYSVSAGVGCTSSSQRFYFYQGKQKIGETRSLPCPPSALRDSLERMESLMRKY